MKQPTIFSVFKILILFPTILVLAIYFTIKHIRLEYFNNDIVEYEMAKYNSGDQTGFKLIQQEIEIFIDKNKIHIYILSIVMWGIKIYSHNK